MKRHDGSTRGPKNKNTPHHKQTTKHLQTSYPDKATHEDFICPRNVTTNMSAGDKAVSKFPLKY